MYIDLDCSDRKLDSQTVVRELKLKIHRVTIYKKQNTDVIFILHGNIVDNKYIVEIVNVKKQLRLDDCRSGNLRLMCSLQPSLNSVEHFQFIFITE